jgi:hypothetical protein
MKELYIFLTHHFEEPFLSFIKGFPPKNCVILFDSDNVLPEISLKIPIVKMKRIKTSYDMYGHSMYISFLRFNKQLVDKCDYIWVIENDVYVPHKIMENGKFTTFMSVHRKYDYDLMVPEYGVRKPEWRWLRTLKGFNNAQPIGITGVIMRFSKRLMKELLNIDTSFSGYMEAVLPHLCLDRGFSIQCFLPEYIGKVTSDRDDVLLRQIMKHPELIEEKLYHPFKKPTVQRQSLTGLVS